ncbi:MAG TPA: type II toxin-antitoxin system HicA family toxin [Tepidisphaeraceae bacterium]|nr:type II toxin-antitoxin system HicA family toxin [Tepidisphaeraceae bacterium]
MPTSRSKLARLRPHTYREIRRKLTSAGFQEVRQRGSHVKFMRITNDGTRVAIVPRHSSDIPLGTLRSILNQAGLTPEQFDHL